MGEIVQCDALGVVQVDVAAGVDHVGGQAVGAVHAGRVDAVGHQLGQHGRGLHVVLQRVAALQIQLEQRVQRAADGHVRAGTHHHAALVLRQEQLVVGLAGRAVEVHPQNVPVALCGRGAVVLGLGAVDPEQVARANDVALTVVIQRAFTADAHLDQVGGQVFTGGVVVRAAVEIPQLLHIGDGGAHSLGGRHRDPQGLVRQIQVEAQFHTRHG